MSPLHSLILCACSELIHITEAYICMLGCSHGRIAVHDIGLMYTLDANIVTGAQLQAVARAMLRGPLPGALGRLLKPCAVRNSRLSKTTTFGILQKQQASQGKCTSTALHKETQKALLLNALSKMQLKSTCNDLNTYQLVSWHG